MTLPSGDARDIIERFDITSEDENYEYWSALQDDEAFTVACQRYKQAALYARHDYATAEDKATVALLKNSVFKHAGRVGSDYAVEVDDA